MKTNNQSSENLLPSRGRSGGVSSLSRAWFAGRGFIKVPSCFTTRPLYYHPTGFFVGSEGSKQKPHLGLCNRERGKNCYNGKRGIVHPQMRHYGNVSCHRLAAYALSQVTEPPTYVNDKGKTLKKVVHHLISEPMNFCADNLLFWLTGAEHYIADRRQRALQSVVPDGNLHVFTYDRLRTLQDPRVTSNEQFEMELAKIKKAGFRIEDPEARMENETTRHMEI